MAASNSAATGSLVDSYMQGFSKGFREVADCVIVAGGRSLPAHSQMLASQCEVLSSLLQSLKESGPQTGAAGAARGSAAQGPLRPEEAAAAAAAAAEQVPGVSSGEVDEAGGGRGVLLHLEEDQPLPYVLLFLSAVYHPHTVPSLIQDLHGCTEFGALLQLADKYAYEALLAALEAHLNRESYPPAAANDPLDQMLLADQWGWLALAEKHGFRHLTNRLLGHLLRTLGGSNGTEAGRRLLAQTDWRNVSKDRVLLLLDGLASSLFRAMDSGEIKDRVVRASMPAEAKLSAWQRPGAFCQEGLGYPPT